MATDTSLQQVALGFDAAKQTIYRIMKQYYPKIEDSKSSLVNAIISGIAYIYSMFQVFAKLLQSELYVSTARELESLYKLIPFVGITLDQPTPMLITATTQPQDDSITDNTVPPLYIQFPDPFLDSASFNFHQTYKQYLRKVAFDFTLLFNNTDPFFVYLQNGLTLSLGKLLGDNYIPPSMSGANGDYFSIEVPYYNTTLAIVQKARIKFIAPLQDLGVIVGAPNAVDDGSDDPAAVNFTLSSFDIDVGKIEIVLNSPASSRKFSSVLLKGLPVNVTYSVRSTYRKPETVSAATLSNTGFDPTNVSNDITFFNKNYIYDKRHIAEVPATALVLNAGTDTADKTWVFFARSGLDALNFNRRVAIDPMSVKIKHTVDTTIVFDFANAVAVADPYYGTIYKVDFLYPGNSQHYFAYVLDEFVGVIYFENPLNVNISLGDFTVDYTSKPSNKVFLEQYDAKIKSVSPPADFNFDNNTFTLEDDDPILFNDLNIQITDAGYSTLQFQQVTSLVTVKGSATQAYFEVRVLSPTKVEIKFDSAVDYTTIQNLLINYRTVKDISLYKSGEVLNGVVNLYKADGTIYSVSGKTAFPFSAVNVSSLAGASGIPTLEGLRDALTKAAYTLNVNITRINYESAIEGYFLGLGYDSRIKVFDYADFGNPSVLLNSVNGNIVYFIGLVNHYPNSDFVVVVPTELNSTPYIEGTAQYSRSDFAAQVPQALTDIGLDMIVPVGKSSNDLDILQNSIRDDSALTNIIFTEGSNNVTLGITPFSVMYAIYFKALLNPADGFTYTQAKVDVSNYLASLFKWSTLNFIRDINVSDVYRAIDSLPSVDKILFSNFSHYRNNTADGPLVVHDITYKKFFTTPSGADILANPLWDFSKVNTLSRGIKVHILGLGGIDLSPYPNV
jgi:hypothetical protein